MTEAIFYGRVLNVRLFLEEVDRELAAVQALMAVPA